MDKLTLNHNFRFVPLQLMCYQMLMYDVENIYPQHEILHVSQTQNDGMKKGFICQFYE